MTMLLLSTAASPHFQCSICVQLVAIASQNRRVDSDPPVVPYRNTSHFSWPFVTHHASSDSTRQHEATTCPTHNPTTTNANPGTGTRVRCHWHWHWCDECVCHGVPRCSITQHWVQKVLALAPCKDSLLFSDSATMTRQHFRETSF